MRNFNHLQSEIMLDIITRLPVDSILNCKLVCRPWRDLVSHHPSFYQMYISHLNHSTDSGKLSFLVEAENQFHYFEYDENNKGTPIDSIRRININPAFENVDYFHYGSVNGLIYPYKWRDHPSCICNPVTREYVMLPTPETSYGVNEHIHVSSGFGYVSLTNEYKVVELYKLWRDNASLKVAVYTLGSGKGWRCVGRFLDYKNFQELQWSWCVCKWSAALGG